MPPKKKAVRKKTTAKKQSPSTHMPVKKKTLSHKGVAKKKSAGNPMPAGKETDGRQGGLQEAIADQTATVFTQMGRSTRTAEPRKPEPSNWGLFTVWLSAVIFLFGAPLLVYLIYHRTKQDGK